MSPPLTTKDALLNSGTKRKRSESATPITSESTSNAPISGTTDALGKQFALDILEVFKK